MGTTWGTIGGVFGVSLGVTVLVVVMFSLGVAAWARRVIVEERRWLTEREYAEVLGLGQVLPGPNVGNAAVMIGRRFHGLPGALLATAGIYCAPLLILIALSFWTWVWGTVGALLAVPLLIMGKTVLDAAGRPDIAGFLFEDGTLTHVQPDDPAP